MMTSPPNHMVHTCWSSQTRTLAISSTSLQHHSLQPSPGCQLFVNQLLCRFWRKDQLATLPSASMLKNGFAGLRRSMHSGLIHFFRNKNKPLKQSRLKDTFGNIPRYNLPRICTVSEVRKRIPICTLPYNGDFTKCGKLAHQEERFGTSTMGLHPLAVRNGTTIGGAVVLHLSRCGVQHKSLSIWQFPRKSGTE